MGMEKKNPYVMTLGFNRRDPNHVRVAEFLNEMERGKTHYIVNAVMEYQNKGLERETMLSSAELRYIVEETVREYMKKNSKTEEIGGIHDQISHPGVLDSLNKQEYSDILDSIELFKSKF